MSFGIEDSLGKAVMIESTKRMTQARNLLARFNTWTWEDFEDYVLVGVWQEDRAAEFYRLEELAKAKGFSYPAQAFRNMDKELRKATSTSFHLVDHAGGISGLGSMVFMPEEGYRSWNIYNPSILTANYQTEGNFGRIHGNLGSGKTNVLCVVLERWATEENHVALGNIRLEKADERYRFVRTAKEFFETVVELPEKTRWLFGLDDSSLYYGKMDQATRRVKDLDKFMLAVRKLKGSIVFVVHLDTAVPNVLMQFSRNIIHCPEQKVVSIELRGPNLKFRDTVSGFPKSTLPFDTWDIATFPINLDIQALLQAISGADDSRANLREFLKTGEAPRVEYESRICKRAGCGKSLVGLHPAAKYCSQYCRQTDYVGRVRRKGSLMRETQSEPEKKSLNEFLS